MTATSTPLVADIVVDNGRAAPISPAARGNDDLTHLARPTYLGPRGQSKALSIAIRSSVPIVLFGLWWASTDRGWVSKKTLASPGQVWRAFREIQTNGQLRDFVLASASRAGWGITIGVSIGLVLGLAAGLTALAEGVVDPAMQMLRTIPFIALSPLFILWFGIDEKYKIVLIAYATSLPMYAYAYLGVRNVDRKVIEAARGFGLRGWRLTAKVILPSALPNVLMALRICLALSMTALIIAEGIGTNKGIGYLVLLGKQYFRTDYMMLSIVLYAVLGLLFDAVIRTIERYAMPWRRHTTMRG